MGGVKAQSGALTIINNNATCGVYVSMNAWANTFSFPSCSLQGNDVYVAPLSSASFTSFSAFTSAVGWVGTAGPSSSATDFKWQEAEFQFDCFGAFGCSNGGTYVNDPITGCTTPRTASRASSAGGCVVNISWVSASGLDDIDLDDITVTFN